MIPVPKRRWFRLSLRTMFVLLTVFGCWLGYQVHWIRQRHEFLEIQQQARIGHPKVLHTTQSIPAPRAPATLAVFGETGYSVVYLWVDGRSREALTELDQDHVREARRLFPEAQVGVFSVWRDESGSGTWGGYP